MEQKKFKIEIVREDGIDGFGAYLHPTLTRDGKAHVILDIEGIAIACLTEDISFKEMLLTTVLHEFAHVLEEFYGLEFSEDRVEALLEVYAKKYQDEYEQSKRDMEETNFCMVASEKSLAKEWENDEPFFDADQTEPIPDIRTVKPIDIETLRGTKTAIDTHNILEEFGRIWYDKLGYIGTLETCKVSFRYICCDREYCTIFKENIDGYKVINSTQIK